MLGAGAPPAQPRSPWRLLSQARPHRLGWQESQFLSLISFVNEESSCEELQDDVDEGMFFFRLSTEAKIVTSRIPAITASEISVRTG